MELDVLIVQLAVHHIGQWQIAKFNGGIGQRAWLNLKRHHRMPPTVSVRRLRPTHAARNTVPHLDTIAHWSFVVRIFHQLYNDSKRVAWREFPWVGWIHHFCTTVKGTTEGSTRSHQRLPTWIERLHTFRISAAVPLLQLNFLRLCTRARCIACTSQSDQFVPFSVRALSNVIWVRRHLNQPNVDGLWRACVPRIRNVVLNRDLNGVLHAQPKGWRDAICIVVIGLNDMLRSNGARRIHFDLNHPTIPGAQRPQNRTPIGVFPLSRLNVLRRGWHSKMKFVRRPYVMLCSWCKIIYAEHGGRIQYTLLIHLRRILRTHALQGNNIYSDGARHTRTCTNNVIFCHRSLFCITWSQVTPKTLDSYLHPNVSNVEVTFECDVFQIVDVNERTTRPI
jgi:hypothetical protein